GRPGGLVRARHHRAERPDGDLGAGGGPEPVVEGPRLVGLPVPERDPADPLHRNDLGQGRRDGREERPGPGGEEEGVVDGQEEEERRDAGAVPAADSCTSASWLTLAVSSARADSRLARLETPAESCSSSSTTSLTASFMSVSRSLARSRTSSTKSFVSSTTSS